MKKLLTLILLASLPTYLLSMQVKELTKQAEAYNPAQFVEKINTVNDHLFIQLTSFSKALKEVSPDGTRIALYMDEVQLFDLESGKEIDCIRDVIEGTITSMQFNFEGTKLILNSGAHRKEYDALSLERAKEITAAFKKAEAKSFHLYAPLYMPEWGLKRLSPDSTQFALLVGYTVYIFDAATGQEIALREPKGEILTRMKELSGHNLRALSFEFNPEGTKIIFKAWFQQGKLAQEEIDILP